MIEDIQRLLDRYVEWLRDRTTLRQVEDWVEITTPYLDRHNDYLQIYARPEAQGFLLTDDGYIIQDLEHSGCKLDTPKRRDLLKITLAGYGAQLREGALEVSASAENFALRKHNLVQAMLAVNDLFYLAEPTVASLFHEDVIAWLDRRGIRYTPDVQFTGRTGYTHRFHFVIPKSRAQPERIVEDINRPDRNRAQAVAFKWMDTRDVRPAESRAYVLLNDASDGALGAVSTALSSYGMLPVLWSKREEVATELES